MQAVSSKYKMEELTIPMFQKMVGEKLEEVNDDEIYMSDESEDDDDVDVDECCICTEPLHQDLVNIAPCQHQFHQLCINDWLNKNMTCPKCRADVEIKSY